MDVELAAVLTTAASAFSNGGTCGFARREGPPLGVWYLDFRPQPN